MSDIRSIIEAKRDAKELSADQIDRLVLGYSRGEVPDYLMSAWLMAAYLNGLTEQETVYLTDTMIRSGRRIDLSHISGVIVDKHSTGGVADSTTLVLVPLLGACGLKVAKMSGRGLGFTGGTLDKLDSIPGFSSTLTVERFVDQVESVGVAVMAQSEDIVPADKKLYALRDVTGTVPSIPLIVSSILSKKIAGGAQVILLDVKFGSGAFMKTIDQAMRLSEALTRVGGRLGVKVTCVITDMNAPLGTAVGNALEVAEAFAVLRNERPGRLRELCVELATRILVLAMPDLRESAARARVIAALEDGSAARCAEQWIDAQGGDPRVVQDPTLLLKSERTVTVSASRSGYVASCDAESIGRAACALGAGRSTVEGSIDFTAGVNIVAPVGSFVAEGDPVFEMHCNRESEVGVAESLLVDSLVFAMEPPPPKPLVVE